MTTKIEEALLHITGPVCGLEFAGKILYDPHYVVRATLTIETGCGHLFDFKAWRAVPRYLIENAQHVASTLEGLNTYISMGAASPPQTCPVCGSWEMMVLPLDIESQWRPWLPHLTYTLTPDHMSAIYSNN